MAQPVTDCISFLGQAKNAIENAERIKKSCEQLSVEEKQLERQLEAEKKALADEISFTIKKRQEEITASYDKEIGKEQERLKKAKAKREKAKNQGIKERIAEETAPLRDHNRELCLKIKSLFQKERLPSFCRRTWYYALYMPRTLKEFLLLFLLVLLIFAALPWGFYLLIQETLRKSWMLILIYLADILLFGGLYLLTGNKTKMEHMETIKKGRQILDSINSNHKKIRSIERTIRKDRNEAIYNLERFDDEIAKITQEIKDLTAKKQDALNTFNTVTKTIISDEITSTSQIKIQELEESHQRTEQKLHERERELKTLSLEITDNYEIYLGKEFMHPDKINELSRIVRMGQASTLTEAIAQYKTASAR